MPNTMTDTTLRSELAVHSVVAVLKAANFRSEGLLLSLGFRRASAQQAEGFGVEPDEIAMVRAADGSRGG